MGTASAVKSGHMNLEVVGPLVVTEVGQRKNFQILNFPVENPLK
jgi:hypothetical protein